MGYLRRYAAWHDRPLLDTPVDAQFLQAVEDYLVETAARLVTGGAVCFCWDGGQDEVYDIAFPAAAARGQRHTLYAVTSWLDTANRITSGEMLEMHQAGWEIGSHSVNNQDMTAKTVSERAVEWDDSKTAIEAVIGSGNCRHWSYPAGGIFDATTASEGYLRYSTQRGLDGNRAGLSWLPIGPTPYMRLRAFAWASVSHSALLELLRWAARAPVVVVVRAETITDGTSGPTSSQLTEALDLVDSIGLRTLTIEEAYGSQLWHPNPGFEAGTAGWYKAGGGSFSAVVDTPMDGVNGAYSGKVGRTGAEATVWVKARCPLFGFAQTHTLSFRYRIDDRGGSGNVIASGRSIDQNETSQGNVALTLTATSWTQASVDFTAHALARQLEVEFSIPGTRDADLYIDHVHVGPKAHGVYG